MVLFVSGSLECVVELFFSFFFLTLYWQFMWPFCGDRETAATSQKLATSQCQGQSYFSLSSSWLLLSQVFMWLSRSYGALKTAKRQGYVWVACPAVTFLQGVCRRHTVGSDLLVWLLKSPWWIDLLTGSPEVECCNCLRLCYRPLFCFFLGSWSSSEKKELRTWKTAEMLRNC